MSIKKTFRFSLLSGALAIVTLVVSLLPMQALELIGAKSASAAALSLIVDNSFNQDINQNWNLWKSADSVRSYVLARGYQSPFGYGPYSLSVSAAGAGTSVYDAGIVSIGASQFTVNADKPYILSFQAKASTPTTIDIRLENVSTYQVVSLQREVAISTGWVKYQLMITPTASGKTSLNIAVGALPDGATLYIDNLNLFESNATLSTSKVSGYIGDQNKSVNIVNGNLYSPDEIKIELPYSDATTGTVGIKQFSVKNIKNSTATFDIPESTFSGIGKVYAAGSLIGQFEYQVLIKIKEFSPNPVSVDEDLVIYGTGFTPDKANNFVAIKTMDAQGKIIEKWLTPHTIDSKLTQLVVKLPAGITNSQLSVRNYYSNIAGVSVEMKSNELGYNIKPMIYHLDWSNPGYEQIGDKIAITGKGLVTRPIINFYDESGKFISKVNATVKSINETSETIEAPTPRQLNKLQVTVKVGNYESDKADALTYSARPLLTMIKSATSRKLPGNNATIAAAQSGSTIRLTGQGFNNANPIQVNFPALHDSIIKTYVTIDKIDPKGNWLDVVVPKEAQSGQVSITVNDQESNQVSLEIIPNVISATPLIPSPGEEMTFWTNGVGLDLEQAVIHFQLNNKEEVLVKPTSLTESGYGDVIVKVIAPKAIASDSSAVKVQYGYWLSNQSYGLQTDPYIERASIDPDTHILIIKGYGFSNVITGNKINYKYADGTVVTPKVKVLNVTTTNEGQEIKIQILDSYYYGYVSVEVGDKTSNEVNIGPAVITRIERRIQFVAAENRVMGVLYISGRNFGAKGDVKVGDVWAKTHYRSNTFAIAVVEQTDVYKNPVIITKAQ